VLHRRDRAGLVAITQPAHAWVAGQLARAWGNARFGRVEPREAVCLAAEQHDNGWADWETAPTLNPATGRPHTFLELPRPTHLAIWGGASRWARTLGRYPALLVSLHGTGLYEGYDAGRDPPAVAALVADFLAREGAVQADLLASLRADPRAAPHARPEVVARNRRLVAVWDAMSLAVCGGLAGERTIARVPTVAGETSLTLAPVGDDPTRVAVAPWPFARSAVTLVCEGRRLDATFADEGAMRAALLAAPVETIVTDLHPAG
jgi:Protein of unknown function (DUF3891)